MEREFILEHESAKSVFYDVCHIFVILFPLLRRQHEHDYPKNLQGDTCPSSKSSFLEASQFLRRSQSTKVETLSGIVFQSRSSGEVCLLGFVTGKSDM
jgi:hypothetical protein